MKKRKQLFARYPEANGFLLYTINDLIPLDSYNVASRTLEQQLEQFQLRLQQYLEGKGITPKRVAIKYLIEDCLLEIEKLETNSVKAELLSSIHAILNHWCSGNFFGPK